MSYPGHHSTAELNARFLFNANLTKIHLPGLPYSEHASQMSPAPEIAFQWFIWPLRRNSCLMKIPLQYMNSCLFHYDCFPGEGSMATGTVIGMARLARTLKDGIHGVIVLFTLWCCCVLRRVRSAVCVQPRRNKCHSPKINQSIAIDFHPISNGFYAVVLYDGNGLETLIILSRHLSRFRSGSDSHCCSQQKDRD
jgi:hypothetical protein